MSHDLGTRAKPVLNLRDILESLSEGRDLSRTQARWTFERIMAGDLPEGAVGAILGALWVKGESVSELVGAAEVMRERAVKIRCDADCIDTCGTGGDGVSTFNVSTAAAIIAAAAGAVVAKHGNRSTSRASGSTEVLTRLGIRVDAKPAIVERCLAEVGIGYLNARILHPAMQHAVPIRQTLGVRTIFNLLGPLTNPAGARRQLLGVPRVELMEKMARALLELGAIQAWVVHGEGLCDLTISGTTSVIEVRDGKLSSFDITPEGVGLARADRAALMVESPEASAAVIGSILEGERGPQRDHALLNAGAALVVSGRVRDLGEGVSRAAEAIDDGSAGERLKKWRLLAGP